ncbi:MAG TPA: NAD(P)/FAD-dependent oxidoreductase, partial [Campylobacterales bacterium]|nr:NAD(P)/FAD-dependent oxidoreductase [Campylobacterales bacterium]
HTDAFISQIDARTITFKDGKQLDFDFIIFTAGIKAAPLIEKIETQKNRMEQIIPDDYLRVQGEERLFAIGDCTQIADEAGNILPPTAQTAEKSAAYVANAIEKLEKEETPSPFHTKIDGIFIALGGDYATGMLYDRIKVSGYTAWLLKKAITRFYRFGLELKVNAGYKKRELKV